MRVYVYRVLRKYLGTLGGGERRGKQLICSLDTINPTWYNAGIKSVLRMDVGTYVLYIWVYIR